MNKAPSILPTAASNVDRNLPIEALSFINLYNSKSSIERLQSWFLKTGSHMAQAGLKATV